MAARRLTLRCGCRARRQRWPPRTYGSMLDSSFPARYFASSSLDGSGTSQFHFSGDLGGRPGAADGDDDGAKPTVAVGQSGVMTRTFTESEVAAFGALSGDFNPVHFEVVSESPFDAPIVHGMLYASMFGTTFATLVPGVIYLQQNLKFVNPVYVGDTVTSTIQVRKIKGNIAICDTTTHRVADGTQVIHGEAKVLIPEGMI